MEKRPGNPYRIEKPRTDILWSGSLYPCRENGKIKNTSSRFRAVITAEYIWLNDELAIPLKTVRHMELLNKKRSLGIFFYDALCDKESVIFLCPHDFFGYSAKKMAEMFEILEANKSCTLDNKGFYTPGEDVNKINIEAGCEECGDKDARVCEAKSVFCIGFMPFIGAIKTTPYRRYLCRKHAISFYRETNLNTCLGGNLGFPGLIMAPFYIVKNISSVRNSFSLSKSFFWREVLIFTLSPYLIVTLAVFIIIALNEFASRTS